VNLYARIAVAATTLVVGWQVVDAAVPASSPSHAPTLPLSALEVRLEREVAAPLRERNIGRLAFSRVATFSAAREVRAVVDAVRPGPDGLVAFRVEAPEGLPGRPPVVRFVGRVDATSETGRIELALPGSGDSGGAPDWRPLAEVLADRLR
jgi:hypothetical protein